MGFWRTFWFGVKVGLGVALKLQEKKVIRIKELPSVAAVVEAVDEAIRKRQPSP